MEPPAISASGASPLNDAVTSTEAPVPGGGLAWLLATESSQGHSLKGSKIAGDGGGWRHASFFGARTDLLKTEV